MTLSDHLQAQVAPIISAKRTAPTGWEPGVRYDVNTGLPSDITTEQLEQDVAGKPAEWADLVAHLLPMIPPGHELRLVEARYDPVAWTRSSETREIDGVERKRPATTRPAWRYRFRVVAVGPSAAGGTLDVAELVKIARGNRARLGRRWLGTGRTRTVVISDCQVGKVASGGGTAEFLARVEDKIGQLAALCRAEPCDDLVIVDPGDLIENAFNVTAQLGTNDLSVPDQLRVARAVLTEVVSTLSALHASTRVVTVPSNHGQWRIAQGAGGAAGRPGDDFGVDVHRAVAEAFHLAGRDDITWVIPDAWQESVALRVRGAVLGVVHGHQWRPGKAAEWWQGQTHGDQPTAAASILVHGHYHNASFSQSGAIAGRPRWLLAADAMDGGSDWFRNLTGEVSEPSITTFVINDAGDWDDYHRIVSVPGGTMKAAPDGGGTPAEA